MWKLYHSGTGRNKPRQRLDIREHRVRQHLYDLGHPSGHASTNNTTLQPHSSASQEDINAALALLDLATP